LHTYSRLKAATAGYMLHYGPDQMNEIVERSSAGENLIELMWPYEPVYDERIVSESA